MADRSAANASLEAARAMAHQEFKFPAVELIASIDEAKVRDEIVRVGVRQLSAIALLAIQAIPSISMLSFAGKSPS